VANIDPGIAVPGDGVGQEASLAVSTANLLMFALGPGLWPGRICWRGLALAPRAILVPVGRLFQFDSAQSLFYISANRPREVYDRDRVPLVRRHSEAP
jgi:hypothetical protein